MQKLKVGQTIHFTLTNNPEKEYDADVYAISNTFEQNTKAVAVHAMVKGNKQGLIDGILTAGEELKAHFPWQVDDENELSNQISKG